MQNRVFVICLWVLGGGSAQAQDLYDFACCPNDDCRSAEVGHVEHAADGYHIAGLKEVIGFDDPRIRTSRDQRYHICTRSTATPNMVQTQVEQLGAARTLKCLYVPAMS